MLDVVKFWLIEGADGLRADAVNHLFESESLSDEPYIDPEGDRTQYDNLIHDHTVNMVKSSILFTDFIIWRFFSARIL